MVSVGVEIARLYWATKIIRPIFTVAFCIRLIFAIINIILILAAAVCVKIAAAVCVKIAAAVCVKINLRRPK